MVHGITVFFTLRTPRTNCYSHGRSWKYLRILASGFLLMVITGYCESVKPNSEQGSGHNYRSGDTSFPKTARDANSQQRRFGWLKVKPLWMDMDKSCFARTCIAPYAVQVISIEPSINHTATFDIHIDDPMPPVDMFFPTPPFKPRSVRKMGDVTPSESSDMVSTTANFSVGLFGVDPTYRFPRHCHSMIENSATFLFPPGTGAGKMKRPPVLPPSIISFGADCLNLTFQIFVIPAMPDPNSVSGDGKGQTELGEDSADNLSLLGAAAASETALNVRTPVPMWIVAILAGVNAALLFAVIALVWHVALSAKKKRTKRLRRQRSSAASSATTTTNSYVPSCTTPMTRRITPPLPPPPLRPPPTRSMAEYDQNEPKYDVPWTDSRPNETYKITFSTLQHKQKDPHFFNYYFASDEQKTAPVIGDGVNGSERGKPLRRTTTPVTTTTTR